MRTNEVGSILMATLVLAGLAVLIAGGPNTVQILYAGTSGWGNVVKAAAYGK